MTPRFAFTWAYFSIAGWTILAAVLFSLRIPPAPTPLGALIVGSIVGLWIVGPILLVSLRK